MIWRPLLLIALLASPAAAAAATPSGSTPLLLLNPPAAFDQPQALHLRPTCGNGVPMRAAAAPRPPLQAMIVGILSVQQARRLVLISEARNGMTIDPCYANDLRVVLRILGTRLLVVAVVPGTLVVPKGKVVLFWPGHGDAGNPCFYTPNLVGPAP